MQLLTKNLFVCVCVCSLCSRCTQVHTCIWGPMCIEDIEDNDLVQTPNSFELNVEIKPLVLNVGDVSKTQKDFSERYR